MNLNLGIQFKEKGSMNIMRNGLNRLYGAIMCEIISLPILVENDVHVDYVYMVAV